MKHASGAKKEYAPRLIAWELTEKCELQCKHCRISHPETAQAELTTEQCKKLLDNIAAHFQPIMILTGGNPLLRDDFFELARYGVEHGLKMVAASCGYGITEETVQKMKQAGIMAVSFSLDGEDAQSHDTFRKSEGSFETIITATRICRAAGLLFQINTTVTKLNMHSIRNIFSLAKQLGASQFHPFLLVPTGRGKGLRDVSLSAEEYEKTLLEIYQISQAEPGIRFHPTCAPQYNRIILQQENDQKKIWSGCMGGRSFAFISATGQIKICGFLDVVGGDLSNVDFDFNKLWNESNLFKNVRDFDKYEGKCRACKYRTVCGGCRARAYEVNHNYLGEEPYCAYPGS